MTFRILNWAEYAEDPVVLAWKQMYEAANGSVNKGRVTRDLTRLTAGDVRRGLVAGVQEATGNNWQVRRVAKIRVQNVNQSGGGATLMVCLWGPSVGFYQQNGEYVGDPEVFWHRQKAQLNRQQGDWKVTSLKTVGKCQGKAP